MLYKNNNSNPACNIITNPIIQLHANWSLHMLWTFHLRPLCLCAYPCLKLTFNACLFKSYPFFFFITLVAYIQCYICKIFKVFTYVILFSLIRKSISNITSFTSRDCDAQDVESLQSDEPAQLLATSLALKHPSYTRSLHC